LSTISLPLDNLIGGVSQQPTAQRPLTGMRAEDNTYADVAEGLIRRPPLEFVAALSGAEGTTQLVHPILRDDDEQYLAWFGTDAIKVFDLDGVEYPVHSDNASASYAPDYTYLKTPSDNPLALEEDPAVDKDIELLKASGAWTSIPGTATVTLTEIDTLDSNTLPGPNSETSIMEIEGDNSATGTLENSALWLEASTVPWTDGLKYVFSCYFKKFDTSGGGDSFDDLRVGFLKGGLQPEAYAWAKFTWVGEVLTYDSVYAPDVLQLSGGVEDIGDGWYRAYVVYDANDALASTWTTYLDGNNVSCAVIYTMPANTSCKDYAFGPHLTITDAATPVPANYYDVTVLRATSVADFTFVVNNSQTVAMTGNTTSALSGTNAIAFVKEAAYGKSYTITVKIDGTEYERSVETNSSYSTAGTAPNANTNEIANYLDQSYTPSLPGTTTVTRDGSVIHFEDSTVDIEWIKVKDGSGDGFITGFTDEVRTESDLPTICLDGYRVKIEGDAEVGEDDYWLQFEGEESSGLTSGVWRESTAPSISYELDSVTMPHTLVRSQDDIDGTVTGVPFQVYFLWGAATWDDRIVGDTDTNPEPSIVGQRIADIFFYRNRLGMLSGDNVVLSGNGDFFNTWRTTVQVLPDDDPIDFAVTGTDVADLQVAVEFNSDLLLFDRDRQYRLYASDTLTPSTVESAAILHHDCSTAAKPVPSGRTLFMAGPRGDYSIIREVFDRGNGTYEAPDITKPLQTFIEGDVTALAASRTEDVLAVLTENTNYLYVHNYHWTGNEKVLSSWRRWTLPATITGVYIVVIDEWLWMVTQDASGIYLERFQLGVDREDYDGYKIHLDRRIDSEVWPSEYVAMDDQTYVRVPYYVGDAPPETTMIATGADEIDYTHGDVIYTSLPAVDNELEFTEDGDLTGIGSYYVGYPMASTIDMTEPSLKTEQGRHSHGDLRVKRLLIDYEDTEVLRVDVTPVEGTLVTEALTNSTTEDGTFDVPIRSRSDGLLVQIKSYLHYPFKLQRAEWIASYTARSRRPRG